MDDSVKAIEYISVFTFKPMENLSEKLEMLSAAIRETTKISFISPANYFPIPPGIPVPNEIPRMTMETKEGSVKLHITAEQLQIAISSTQISSAIDFSSLITKLSDCLINKFSFEIIRLGLISRNYKLDPEPAKYIARNFMNSQNQNYSECNIRLVERRKVQNLEYNYVYQLDSSLINLKNADTDDFQQHKAILITIDINSDQHNKEAISEDRLKTFVNESIEFLDSEFIEDKLS
ncbi:hypothetical protein [Acinetobacter sp. YH12105]|uniref:hypothetical protein n=1 Tax=Acinetobacter sp. YH12105 TaxID=2601093 RepID=UPI0015D29EE7|nr:hypothetical protein [Acinetobacter sp. YH12105]